jgi:benzoyl-CoA reductase/2-hydroxyglutaryl-CoA dehydratase subunit BcrC/BadD/HgdB
MGLIGYTCSYTPAELLAATGFKPYRLLHGDVGLSAKGENSVRVDACSLVKLNIGYLIENQEKFVAIVGSTGCDMARRMFDVISELTDIPVYLFNNPRTDKPRIFYDEIDWLVGELENLSKKKFSPKVLETEIQRWEEARNRYRVYAQKRAQNPSLISTTNFQQVAMNYHKGDIELSEFPSCPFPTGGGGNRWVADKPRVYLLGSPFPYEAHQILELLELNLRIAGDFNCGISRFLNINIKEKNLNGIKDAYYNQPPCIFKRPNKQFYEFVGTQIKQLECKGIIAWTLDYCDIYEFELKRIERIFQLPVLRIRSNLSFQNLNQLKTRIGAFAEMLA